MRVAAATAAPTSWRRRFRRLAASSRGAVIAIGVLAPPMLAAQDTTGARIDSLQARLERAEERLRAIDGNGDAQTTTRPRFPVSFRGRVLMNAFANSGRVNSTGTPSYVLPDDPGELDPRGLAMTIRQTTLGIAITAPDVLGASFLGDLEVDFHGGQLASSGGRAFALVRMRTARAVLKWERTELLFGQASPLLSPVDPVSLSAVGTPLFSGAGNLWLWAPQVRLTVERPGAVNLALQGAVAAPTIAAPVGSFEVSSFDLAERSRRPFLQARLRGRWGEDADASEAGLALHTGWYAIGRDSLSRGYAASIDLSLRLGGRVELRGEAYDGKGTRSLGGGAIVQLFGADGQLIRSRGGWLQANVHLHPLLDAGGGFGVDDPNDTDVSATSRLKNTVAAAHVHWRPAAPLVFGLEYRRTATSYVTDTYANHHINLAFGIEF